MEGGTGLERGCKGEWEWESGVGRWETREEKTEVGGGGSKHLWVKAEILKEINQ